MANKKVTIDDYKDRLSSPVGAAKGLYKAPKKKPAVKNATKKRGK